MIFLFTKSKLIGSKLIRYGLDEPCSHMALVWGKCKKSERDNGLVCHSELFGGFNIDWWPHYRNEIEVVKAIVPRSIEMKDGKELTNRLIGDLWGANYDKPALCYFAYRAILRKFFDKPLPSENPWSNDNDILCTGIVNALKDLKPEWFYQKFDDGDIFTPWGMYLSMIESGYFDEIDQSAL